MLAKEFTPLVTGAGKGGIGGFGVTLERAEKRREQGFLVAPGCGFQLVTVVVGVVAGGIEHAGDLQQHVTQVLIGFQRAASIRRGDQKNRDVETGALHDVQGASRDVVDRKHCHGDVGVIGLVEGNDRSRGGEAMANTVVGRNIQAVHAHLPSKTRR